jgi:hypothetical protein
MTFLNFRVEARHAVPALLLRLPASRRAAVTACFSKSLGVGENVRPRGFELHATFLDRRLRTGIAEEGTSECCISRSATAVAIQL